MGDAREVFILGGPMVVPVHDDLAGDDAGGSRSVEIVVCLLGLDEEFALLLRGKVGTRSLGARG